MSLNPCTFTGSYFKNVYLILAFTFYLTTSCTQNIERRESVNRITVIQKIHKQASAHA